MISFGLIVWLAVGRPTDAHASVGLDLSGLSPQVTPASEVASSTSAVEEELLRWTLTIEQALRDSNDAIPDDGSPPDEHQRGIISASLNVVETTINIVLDILDEGDPSMTSFASATLMDLLPSYEPATLIDYGEDCVELSGEAVAELIIAVETEDWDEKYVRDRMDTILHLITRSQPHNYRTMAGIE